MSRHFVRQNCVPVERKQIGFSFIQKEYLRELYISLSLKVGILNVVIGICMGILFLRVLFVQRVLLTVLTYPALSPRLRYCPTLFPLAHIKACPDKSGCCFCVVGGANYDLSFKTIQTTPRACCLPLAWIRCRHIKGELMSIPWNISCMVGTFTRRKI